jgi:hypothetical protein
MLYETQQTTKGSCAAKFFSDATTSVQLAARIGPLVALAAFHAGQVHAVQEHRQVGGRDGEAGLSLGCPREAKRTGFQSPIPDRESVSQPVKNLHAIGSLAAEHEQMAGERIGLEHLADSAARVSKLLRISTGCTPRPGR